MRPLLECVARRVESSLEEMLVVGVLPQRQLPETSSQPYLDRTLLTLPSAATLLIHRTSSSDAVLMISVLPSGPLERRCLLHLPAC